MSSMDVDASAGDIAPGSNANGGTGGAPCGACKFLRRKCVYGCIFAPYFDSEQGVTSFAAVHKVFGASKASKLLHQITPLMRSDAVFSICYEAQARLHDPIYGCTKQILALQEQVLNLQSKVIDMQHRLAQQQQLHQQQFVHRGDSDITNDSDLQALVRELLDTTVESDGPPPPHIHQ